MKRQIRWVLIPVLGLLAAFGLLTVLHAASTVGHAARPTISASSAGSPALHTCTGVRRKCPQRVASDQPADEASPRKPATANTNTLVRLTHDGQSTPLAWTGDGQHVLVRRPGEAVENQQLSELWAISTTGKERQLSSNAFLPAHHGNEIAFLAYTGPERWQAIRTGLENTLASTSLGEARWGLPPTWIDGQVTYLEPGGTVRATATGPLVWASQLSFQEQARARLSRDGQHLAWTDGQRLLDVHAGGQSLVAEAGQIWGFAWSPAAAHLAYVRTEGGPTPSLWVWDAEQGTSRMLLQLEMSFLGAPVWSPDGATLAIVVEPTSSGPVSTGDIWLVDVESAQARLLAETRASERAPCWSPDGQHLALEIDGDVWLLDLRAPDRAKALQQVAQTVSAVDLQMNSLDDGFAPAAIGLTPPLTIRVKHDAAGNDCRSVPDGSVQEYDFEEYVKRVVPHEVYITWPTETLKAQSVAARTYAWRRLLDRATDPYVWDSTNDQYMCDQTYPATDAAVEATTGQYVSYQDRVAYTFYCSRAGSPTNYLEQLNLAGAPYLRPVDDPVSFGETRHGHSWGMSQWGAYRWAAWHGWDYQQILAHYYSVAEIAKPASQPEPLSGLVLPWPDHYLRTHYAHLRANASDDSAVVTVTFAARITDTWTTLYTDTEGTDGWNYAWPVATISDTYTPSIQVRATAYDGSGNVEQSPASQIGLHRTPPTGTLGISQSTVYTLNVTLDVSASDPAPVSGTIRVGLGNDIWTWQDTDLYASGGETVADSAAIDGSAWHANPGGESVLYGPYAADLPFGQYRALFRVRVPTSGLTLTNELARFDVAVQGGATLLGIRYLRGTDVLEGDSYQEFGVDFEYTAGDLEFRTRAYGDLALWVDSVRLVSYPGAVQPQVQWTLPAREGPVTVTATFVDGAGNMSAGVPLTVSIVDDTSPGEWQGFRYGAGSCSVQVRDAIAGLDPSSGEYQVSTDNGLSWSAWLPATSTGALYSHEWEMLATTAPLPAASPLLIRFRVADGAATPNVGQSPEYVLWRAFLPLILRNGP